MNKNTAAELEVAATAYILKEPDSKHACPACGEITAYVTDIKTFITGAKWQAEQYAEALQLMREMAEALKDEDNHWHRFDEEHERTCTACNAYAKYRASHWGKE